MPISRLRHFILALLLLFAPLTSFAGFTIQNGKLLDANGVPFVMRGINYPFVWYAHRYPSGTEADFAAMKATGANTVRIVLATGGQWTRIGGSDLSAVIELAKSNGMIAVLEVHDSTGWSESSGAKPISDAVSYWTSSDIRAAIDGQEDYVIVNIANEPFGNTTTSSYVSDTISAIKALRSAGIKHNLMVDAANWGQDWSGTMRTNAPTIFAADTLANTTFSVHMYEVYANSSAITSYMQAFQDMGLPLVVGEFGADHQGQGVDEATIMAQAQQRGIGYIGWSWSGNGSCCTSLDIVSNFGTTLTSWGEILVNSTNGIRATSVPATVFPPDGGDTLSVSPTSVSLASSASTANIAVTSNASWTVTSGTSWLSASPTSGTNNGSFTISATANTSGSSRSGTVTVNAGSLSRAISVTQAAATSQDFSLSASSSSLSIARGASGSTTLSINRSGSFAGDVSFAASGLPSGVSASFNPTSTSGNSATLTLSASSSASVGTANITITGTSGSITRSASLALTITSGGDSGTVTVAPAVTSSSGWFTEQQLRLNNTASITALSVTVVVQKTTGVTPSGQYNTIGGQIQQSVTNGSSTITYQFSLGSGQTLSAGTNRIFAVQLGGNGTVHPSSGDTYSVTYTSGGQTATVTGTF
jgi:mannan endo-1,4-beta-mannosidase